VISRVWEATTAKRMQIDPYCVLDSYIQNGKAGLEDWLAYLRVCVNNDA